MTTASPSSAPASQQPEIPKVIFDEAAWEKHLSKGGPSWEVTADEFFLLKNEFKGAPHSGLQFQISVQRPGLGIWIQMQGAYVNDVVQEALAGWAEKNEIRYSRSAGFRFEIKEDMPAKQKAEQIRKACAGFAEVLPRFCSKTKPTITFAPPSIRKKVKTNVDSLLAVDVEDLRVTDLPDALGDVVATPKLARELKEIIAIFKHPQHFKDLGYNLPSGILFHGLPGTGKTMSAGALAKETGMPLYKVGGTDFRSSYMNASAQRLRMIFDGIEGPAIIFLDEIDALVGRRDEGMRGEDRAILQVLQEFLSSAAEKGIFVIAATNKPDDLDPSLTRSKRFDRKVEIPLPGDEARAKIFALTINRLSERAKTKRWNVENLDLDRLAQITRGFSPADIVVALERALGRFAMVELTSKGEMESVRQDMVEEAIAEVREEKSVNPDTKF